MSPQITPRCGSGRGGAVGGLKILKTPPKNTTTIAGVPNTSPHIAPASPSPGNVNPLSCIPPRSSALNPAIKPASRPVPLHASAPPHTQTSGPPLLNHPRPINVSHDVTGPLTRPPALLAPDECGLSSTLSTIPPYYKQQRCIFPSRAPPTPFRFRDTVETQRTSAALRRHDRRLARFCPRSPRLVAVAGFESARQLLFEVEPRLSGRTCYRHGRREERARRPAERAREGLGGMCSPS